MSNNVLAGTLLAALIAVPGLCAAANSVTAEAFTVERPTLLSLGSRMALRALPFNLVVTNVPGPPFPVYVLGAKMAACWP